MAEEVQTVTIPKKSSWLSKVPREVLFSPGGIILLFFAAIIEVIDLIPVPIIDQIWELPLELIFMIFFVAIVRPPIKAVVIPFIVERLPIINDVLPTWVIKMIM